MRRIGKLEGGKDIQFMVELEHKEQTVICYLVCEDIGKYLIHLLLFDTNILSRHFEIP